MPIILSLTIAMLLTACSSPIQGQTDEPNEEGHPHRHLRYREETQINGELKLRPATVPPITDSKISMSVDGEWRILESNAISEHNTGEFPNEGNPNTISEQPRTHLVPANPKLASKITEGGWVFGLAVNGVPFDPGAGEFYHGNPRLGWMYDALSGAIDLGFDENHAHVQPEGTYHYHGLPTLLLSDLKLSPEQHSPLIGWAADGFPIYAVYGHEDGDKADSEIIAMTSSYRLRSGQRPGGDEPDGEYDGTFVRDYEYVAGLGTLDECNGRMTVSPDFPDGTYAYFLTEEFPIVPRCFKGNPSQDFAKGRPPQYFSTDNCKTACCVE
ncbi:MAG: YHYH protein [Cyanobacteria bacterium P01_A01_bin.40]